MSRDRFKKAHVTGARHARSRCSESITQRILTACVALALVLAAVPHSQAETREGTQWFPYLEWTLENHSYEGDPFDLVATVTFTHTDSGARHATETFYAGDGIWKFRFTGTRTGPWTFRVSSTIPEWNGQTGVVTIAPNPSPQAHGFITAFDGNKWGWQGVEEAFVPQLVMYKTPNHFYDRPHVVDADIQEFLAEHGFNGFHVPTIASRWFDAQARETRIDARMTHPDPRTFEALEMLIAKVHAAGGMVHIWAWGDHQRHQTPHDLSGGINGPVDRRLQRYIAARLGPVPGWTMGYGFDLWEWVDGAELAAWHAYMHEHFGWSHWLGARATQNTLEQISEAMDYAGYEQHRPDYSRYVETIQKRPGKPSFSEDRFRLRDEGRAKDYSAEDTRRGLWRSTMAGGVANIWGNLLAKGGTRNGELGSAPYPNKAQIKTYATFFVDRGRFTRGLERRNDLSGNANTRVLAKDKIQYLFYREDAARVDMDLSEMRGAQPAVAVDTKKTYAEIRLEILQPGTHTWEAPYRSDWVITVGTWPVPK